MPVGTTDEDHQWDASGIYDDMSFGAALASVGGVGARFLAPGGLAPRSHLCWLGSNQSGHARADVPAWLGAKPIFDCRAGVRPELLPPTTSEPTYSF